MNDYKKVKNVSNKDNSGDELLGVDLSNQSIKLISKSLLNFTEITTLILNNNEIEEIPKDICMLKKLEKLDLSYNKIQGIPSEIGRLINLKEFFINNNLITEVPMELGTLYKLENFNISNNPLIGSFNTMARENSLLRYCRENNTKYSMPCDRVWIDTVLKIETNEEIYSVGSYNTLCSFYATKLTYAPSWVINTECRKNILLQLFVAVNMDILCIQELDINLYNTFYKESMSTKLDYESFFVSKKSFDYNTDSVKKLYGIGIFWKRNRFILIEQITIDFYSKIIADKRFKYLSDVISRNSNKMNLGIVAVLETENTTLIVVNTHLYWHPDYNDVKAIQTVILLEEIDSIKEKYGKNCAVVLAGDFNSLKYSHVYNFIKNKQLDPTVFSDFDYGVLNNGNYKSKISFSDAYDDQNLTFTNFTPHFCGVLDYIFYTSNLNLIGVISPIEEEYIDRTIGLPNIHFPSDHILIGAKFQLKNNK